MNNLAIRASKKGDAIRNYSMALTKPAGDSNPLMVLIGQFDAIKESLVKLEQWESTCDRFGWSYSCEGWDHAA